MNAEDIFGMLTLTNEVQDLVMAKKCRVLKRIYSSWNRQNSKPVGYNTFQEYIFGVRGFNPLAPVPASAGREFTNVHVSPLPPLPSPFCFSNDVIV